MPSWDILDRQIREYGEGARAAARRRPHRGQAGVNVACGDKLYCPVQVCGVHWTLANEGDKSQVTVILHFPKPIGTPLKKPQ